MSDSTTKPEDLLTFPCHYQFKAVGIAGEIFKDSIVAAVGLHVPVAMESVHCKASGKGNYQSVSIYVTLYDYQQLTKIYADLHEVKGLKMLL